MRILSILLFLAIIANCTKKTEQAVQVNLALLAMTNGQWKVTSFIKGGIDSTSSFVSYKFQFKDNNTVDAINNGSVEITGSWNADASAQTITSNFSTSSQPIVLLNGTWQITKNSWTYVEAKQTVNGELRTLRLDKV